VCDTCFELAQQPAADRGRRLAADDALHVHVAGEVLARDRTAYFRTRRAATNEANRVAIGPVVQAYSQLVQRGGSSARAAVAWEPDAERCGACRRGFTPLLRKHHCRLCGVVVCDGCSGKIKANAAEGGFAFRACSRCAYLFARCAGEAHMASRRG
jgi:hypothetical protein